MKPLTLIGIRFDNPDTDQVRFPYAHFNYNPEARNSGVVVSVPYRMEVPISIDDPNADFDDPRTMVDRDGATISTAFIDFDLKVGDEACTRWLDTADYLSKKSGFEINGVHYVCVSEVLFRKRGDDILLYPGNIMVSRITYDEADQLSLDIYRENIPSVGIVQYTSQSMINGHTYKKGDMIFHWGDGGQSHVMPDGEEYELVPEHAILGRYV